MAEYAIYDGAAHPVVARLPDGWDSSWISPPARDEASVNGKTDVCGLVCNVQDIGNRNYFSCIAAGDYTVNVYTDATATSLISTQNVAANVQANWQIDYALCTHQLDTETRQAWVEVVPQSGLALTMLRFNTDHPAETNTNSSPNFVAVVGVLPALTIAENMFRGCYALQNITLPSLPALTSASYMFYACYSLQNITLPDLPALTSASYMAYACSSLQKAVLPDLPALTNASYMFLACYALQSVSLPSLPALTNASYMFNACYALQNITLPSLPALTNVLGIFGNNVSENTCLRSLRKIVIPDITIGFILQRGAIQAEELNALFTSLGTASGAQTIDVRKNPGSATCNTSIATAKGYTVLTA